MSTIQKDCAICPIMKGCPIAFNLNTVEDSCQINIPIKDFENIANLFLAIQGIFTALWLQGLFSNGMESVMDNATGLDPLQQALAEHQQKIQKEENSLQRENQALRAEVEALKLELEFLKSNKRAEDQNYGFFC